METVNTSHGLVSPGDCSLQVATVSLVVGGGGKQSVLAAGGELARLARVRFQRAGQRQDNGEREKGVELLLVVE